MFSVWGAVRGHAHGQREGQALHVHISLAVCGEGGKVAELGLSSHRSCSQGHHFLRKKIERRGVEEGREEGREDRITRINPWVYLHVFW